MRHLSQMHRHKTRRLNRTKPPLAHLATPVMQQAWINIMSGCNHANAGTMLMRLSDYPKLLFNTPAATPVSSPNDLDPLRHHTLSSTLQRALRSHLGPIPPPIQGGPRRTDTGGNATHTNN